MDANNVLVKRINDYNMRDLSRIRKNIDEGKTHTIYVYKSIGWASFFKDERWGKYEHELIIDYIKENWPDVEIIPDDLHSDIIMIKVIRNNSTNHPTV